MKAIVDTNVLVRAVVRDDVKQAKAASQVLKNADRISISLPCLCELVWVLRKVYQFDDADISSAVRALLNAGNATMDRPAVEAGLSVLDAGGDFADGIIAHEGIRLGAEIFVTFDKRAATLIGKRGQATKLLK